MSLGCCFLFGTMDNSRGPGSLNGQRYSFNSLLEELLSAGKKGAKGANFGSKFFTPLKINLKMMVWKMIFLFQGCILRFHVNLQGCTPLKTHMEQTINCLGSMLLFFLGGAWKCEQKDGDRDWCPPRFWKILYVR